MLSHGTSLDLGDHTVEILDTPQATADRYRIRIVAEPGAPGTEGDFPHSHPILIETFTCISGEMTVRLNKQRFVLGKGRKAKAPPGVVHGFVNTGTDPLVIESEVIFPNGYQPRDDLLRFGAIYDRLRRVAGGRDNGGEPPMLQMAVLAHAYRHVIRSTGTAGILLPALSLVGRLRGYRSEFPDFGI